LEGDQGDEDSVEDIDALDTDEGNHTNQYTA